MKDFERIDIIEKRLDTELNVQTLFVGIWKAISNEAKSQSERAEKEDNSLVKLNILEIANSLFRISNNMEPLISMLERDHAKRKKQTW